MRIVPFLIIILFFTQCKKENTTANPKSNPEEIKEVVTVVDTSNWQGTYTGTVPSKNSIGMEMKLSLNPSNTYDLSITFLEDNPDDNQTLDYKGEIQWAEDSTTIILPELDTISNKFRVRQDVVEYLNPDATPNTGELAEFYTLKRKTK